MHEPSCLPRPRSRWSLWTSGGLRLRICALLLVALQAVHAESGLNRIGLVHAAQTDRIEEGCRATLSAQAGFAVTAQQALDRLPSHLCIGKVPAQIWIDDTSYYFCKRCDGQATEEEVRGTSYVVNGTSGDVEVVPEYGL